MQATQNFSIGVILDAESDGNEIFWKFENFTISRNEVRVQPYRRKRSTDIGDLVYGETPSKSKFFQN